MLDTTHQQNANKYMRVLVKTVTIYYCINIEKMYVGSKRIYGDWKDGSVIFKDKEGYYVIQFNNKTKKNI